MREDAVWPYLVVDTWGLGEAIAEADVLRRMGDAAALGAEVFTVDKGWERAVGDWHPNERFPGGLPRLAREAREHGLGLALWCALGNASPAAPVVREHPDWLASWRGATPVFSFGNHALCLGHEPARAWVLERGRPPRPRGRARPGCCTTSRPSPAATRPGTPTTPAPARPRAPPGSRRCSTSCAPATRTWSSRTAGTAASRSTSAMVARHDTTIGDDWARARPNRVARAGLGRFLPPDWCSSYMGDEDLPPRYQVASFLIGGPWVLMGDMDGWDDERRAVVRRGVEVYRRWRAVLRRARLDVLLPPAHAGAEARRAAGHRRGERPGPAGRRPPRGAGGRGRDPAGRRRPDAPLPRRRRVDGDARASSTAATSPPASTCALGAGPDAAVLGLEPLDHR